MKAKIKIIVLSVVACLSSHFTEAQTMGTEYTTALGVKFFPGAISIKHFVRTNRALEGLGYFYRDGFRLTGLYEIHGNINGAAGLKWYIGPGAHFGVWNDSWRKRNEYYYDNDRVSFGVDGVIGLDYKFNGAPINVSLDWQPSFDFVGYGSFQSGWGGLAIRYTF